MPLPERYYKAVPEARQIWGPEGTFKAQCRVWYAEAVGKNRLNGYPSLEELGFIKDALVLTPEELEYLTFPEGHETNRLLRVIQGKLPTPLGNSLHEGNTTRDITDPATSLQILWSLDLARKEHYGLSNNLWSLAFAHKDALQIARTHGQHAVPHTFGRQVLGWLAGNEASISRINRACSVISFGKCSGEVGTNVFISPELEEATMAELGLEVEPAPTQIIPRHRHAEVIGLMAVNSAELIRVASNIRTLSRTEIAEAREPFDEGKQAGSSAMPHKRNPELCERVCGLGRRVKSAAMEALDTVGASDEGEVVNSSIERFTFEDAFGCLVYQLRLMQAVTAGLHVDTERMVANLDKTYGAIYSSRLLNAMLDTGKLSRSEIYEHIKELSHRALDEKVQLQKLAARDDMVTELLDNATLAGLFSPDFYLRHIRTAYKRLGLDDRDETYKPYLLEE